jgi:hypothetical protein
MSNTGTGRLRANKIFSEILCCLWAPCHSDLHLPFARVPLIKEPFPARSHYFFSNSGLHGHGTACHSAGPAQKIAFLEANFDEICTEISGQYEFGGGGHVHSYERSVTSETSFGCLACLILVSYGCPHFHPVSALNLFKNILFLPRHVAI